MIGERIKLIRSQSKDCLWLHRVDGENLWTDETVLCCVSGDETVLCCVCGDGKVFMLCVVMKKCFVLCV